MYGCEATDRLHYKLQTLPLVREGGPRQRAKQKKGKNENLAMGLKGMADTKMDGRLTGGHDINSTVRG
jgi:hypothetical protein